jgi:hypothetical protein
MMKSFSDLDDLQKVYSIYIPKEDTYFETYFPYFYYYCCCGFIKARI